MSSRSSIKTRIAAGYILITLLLVAAVGAGLIQTSRLERQSREVVEGRLPMMIGSLELLSGINASLASTRGYLLINDQSAKERIAAIWNEEILPSLKNLKQQLRDEESQRDLQMVEDELSNMKLSVDRATAVAHTPGNEPAHKLLFTELAPLADKMERVLELMFKAEIGEGADAHLEHFGAIHGAALSLAKTRTILRTALIQGDLASFSSFDYHWKEIQGHVNNLALNETILSPLQREKMAELQELMEGYPALVESIKKIRTSEGWNVANMIMASEIVPLVRKIRQIVERLVEREKAKTLADSNSLSAFTGNLRALNATLLITGIVAAMALGWLITRMIGQKLTAETTQLRVASEQLKQSSIVQLQGVTEQKTATNEVLATMTELTAMAKTIMSRCQEVTGFIDEAADGCTNGNKVVGDAHRQMIELKGQVEKIVNHMLELGKKSQEINLAVEFIRELADQTTILSFNAAIEAAAAGDAGRSFAAIAEQIGKLADRAKEYSRDVRSLVEEVQRSTNKTVMVTEDALKAADKGLGAQEIAFDSMAIILERISRTLEAAREIEISSSQTATAADQVRQGIDNIVVAANHNEQISREVTSAASTITSAAHNLESL